MGLTQISRSKSVLMALAVIQDPTTIAASEALAMRRKHRHKPQQANVIRITFCHLLNQVYAVTVFRHLTSRILRA